jgi:type IV secretory pathway VirB2 component (pilin)
MGFTSVAGDSANGSVITSAVTWIEQLVTGSLGTSIAVLAVASVGLAMLSGRLAIRRGMMVILGCFILFGARTVATGLRGAGEAKPVAAPRALPSPPPIYPKPPASPNQPRGEPYDPYAGAAVVPTNNLKN